MNREILRLAVPNILSNISVPLISTVDTLLMGQLSAAHIGAVGLGSMIFNFIYWNFGFLRMGTTGITAQAFGRNDADQIIHTLARAVVVGLILAVLLLVLQWPFAQSSFWLMNVGDSQTPLVSEYFFIRIWAAPASLLLFAILGWFFGMQNAIFPLILTLFINGINAGLSYYLVIHRGMAVAGVAWGTVVAQYAGLALAILLFLWKYRPLVVHFAGNALFRISEFGQFLHINRDIFIRTICLTFAFAFFYSQSAAGGTLLLAANVILLQFLNWLSFAVDGFAFAAESLVGKYRGRLDEKMTNKAIRYSFIWGLTLAGLFSIFYGTLGSELLTIFSDEPPVIAAAEPYLFWVILLPILATPSYIWDGVFIGLTASKSMRDAMLLALIVYMVCFFTLGQVIMPINALWLSLLIFLVARGIIQGVFYWKKGWELA